MPRTSWRRSDDVPENLIATDEDPSDLKALLDALNDRVDPNSDITIIDGMVSDSLEPASTYENVHSKVIIDATKLVPAIRGVELH